MSGLRARDVHGLILICCCVGSSFIIADLIGVFWNTAALNVAMYMLYRRYLNLRLAHAKLSLAPEVINFPI